MIENKLNVYQRLFEAKKHIASQITKKSGKNAFAKYDYFTPEQVDALVLSACEVAQIDFHFDLKEDSFGVYGELRVVNLDNPNDYIFYSQRSAIPEIKATNRTQQYGGAMTYTRRYMLQNVFCIADNKLDFDHNNGGLADTITDDQVNLLRQVIKTNNIKADDVVQYLSSQGLSKLKDIPKEYFNKMREDIFKLSPQTYPE